MENHNTVVRHAVYGSMRQRMKDLVSVLKRDLDDRTTGGANMGLLRLDSKTMKDKERKNSVEY
jgi:hypothetical protein